MTPKQREALERIQEILMSHEGGTGWNTRPGGRLGVASDEVAALLAEPAEKTYTDGIEYAKDELIDALPAETRVPDGWAHTWYNDDGVLVGLSVEADRESAQREADRHGGCVEAVYIGTAPPHGER